MKYILILLISFAFGQVYVPIHQSEDFDSTAQALVPISADEKICWIADEIITVEDLFDYAEECYNDTSRIDSEVYSRMWHLFQDRRLVGEEVNNNGHKAVLVRKPTLEGLIEWRKEKK